MDLNWTILIAVATSSISGLWTVYQYIETKKREQNLKEFENYHKLIKELVQPDESNAMWIDRQAAIVFELTHFKRYYSFSYRTLLALKEKWGYVPNQYPRLMDELDRSIEFLKEKI
jgi:hypothetical protein